VRRLEENGRFGADPQHRTSGPVRRQSGGLGAVHHVFGVRPVPHAQGQTEVGVRPDVSGDDACRSLGRQHEVHAERAAYGRDAHEAADEVRQLLDEHPELVDHHDKPRERRTVRSVCATCGEGVDVHDPGSR
jgi:hypothetical protein